MAVAADHSSFPARQELETELARMAAQVESNLAAVITAFERRDLAAAEQLIAADRRIDEFDRDIEVRVMGLLENGPLPQDALREVMTVMKQAHSSQPMA